MVFKITGALAILLEHMHKKFEINRTKIKGDCKSERKAVTQNSKSDLPLLETGAGYVYNIFSFLVLKIEYVEEEKTKKTSHLFWQRIFDTYYTKK